MPAASEIHRLKKRRLPAGFLAGDESVKHNRQFNSSLNCLNLIFSRQPNFLATTLQVNALNLGSTYNFAGIVGCRTQVVYTTLFTTF